MLVATILAVSMLWPLAAVAALLMAALAVELRQTARQAESARRASAVIRRTAEMAQALAGAETVEQVEVIVQTHLARVFDAVSAALGIVDRDAGILRMKPSGRVRFNLADRPIEVPLDMPGPVLEALRTGEPVLLRNHADWRAIAPGPTAEGIIRLGIVSSVVLPLKGRHGQVEATLSLSWDHEVAFDGPILDVIRTIGELCEYTLDRARATDEAARRATLLARLAAQLATAVTVAEVLSIVTESASSPVGASATSIGLIDREAGLLRTHHGPAVGDEVRRQFSDPPLDAGLAFTDAARTGQPVLLGTFADLVEHYPQSAAATESLGFGARAALPMTDSEGRVVGAIVHAWAGPRVFHEALRSTLMTIAGMAAQALERTGLAEAEHRLVTSLQDRLLVPLPDAPALDIAARYIPAARDVGMGGDWFEGIVLDDHRYALIVGDVAGHGIMAVADMAQLRAVIGALVRIDTPLAEVFCQTTTLLQDASHDLTASALLIVVDTADETLSYAVAGHPPPMVRRGPAGEVEVLTEGRQPILGLPVAATATAGRVAFPAGTLLLAYTDGLIERRGEPIDVSVDRLRSVLEQPADCSAAPVVEHVLAASLEGHPPSDDVAIVVIARRGGPAGLSCAADG